MDFDLNSLGKSFELLRSAMGVMRDAKELLPDGAKKTEVELQIVQAERAAQLAEAQLAQSLGYHLCKSTFPPQIMLKVSHAGVQETFSCLKCGNSWPPPRINYAKAETEYDPFR
jgi:hypothetical protein